MMPRQMKIWTAASVLCAASLALGACKDDGPASKEAAGGELLPRSASDDMLPYDTVRSQSPLASAEPAVGGDSTVEAPVSDSTEAAAAAEEAAAEASAAEAEPRASAPDAE